MRQIATLFFLLFTLCDVLGFEYIEFSDSRAKRQDFEDNTCRTRTNEFGRCINIRSCPPLVSLLQQISFNPQARDILRQAQCGFEGRIPKVCCVDDSAPQPNIDGRPSTPTIDDRPNPPFTTRPNIDVRPPQPTDNNRPRGNADGPDKFPRQCGKSGSSNDKIVGGKPANLRAWPWIAALGFRSKNSGRPVAWSCGGALVTDRHVVTAAHCLDTKVIMVRLGDLDLNTTDDGANHVDIPTDKQIGHEDYNKFSHTNDIGIVRLRNPVQFSADIQPICLPFSQDLKTKSYVRFSPYIAGWGDLAYKAITSSTRLMEAQVEVKATEECSSIYNKISSRVIIDRRTICAGGDNKDACQGDSGGPLMLPQKEGLFFLFGVVSYGYKCAEPGVPGVYTKVSEFVDWIDANTN